MLATKNRVPILQVEISGEALQQTANFARDEARRKSESRYSPIARWARLRREPIPPCPSRFSLLPPGGSRASMRNINKRTLKRPHMRSKLTNAAHIAAHHRPNLLQPGWDGCALLICEKKPIVSSHEACAAAAVWKGCCLLG